MIAHMGNLRVQFGRRGAAMSASLPLMLAAIVAVGVFLVWLNKVSEPMPVLLQENPDSAGAMGGAMVREVAFTEYAAAPGSFAGQTLRIPSVQVSSIPFGTEGFFWSQSGENLLLFRLEGQALAQITELAAGQSYTVTGSVSTLDDAAIANWILEGRASDDARMELSFASDFFTVQTAEASMAGGAGAAGAGG